MHDRRAFVRQTVAATTALATGWHPRWAERLDDALAAAAQVDAQATVEDEAFWRRVRRAFVLELGLINLNHGYSPSPSAVLEALKREIERTNRAPLYWGRWPESAREPRREDVRRRVAALLGCDAEELALTRSATEALQIVQLGLDLEPGDEVLSTSEDYWAMWSTWQQRVRREGVVYKEVPLVAPYPPPEEIVARLERGITPRTKVLLFSHLTWLTGHILPVRDICRMARSKGVRTIVDGAHALGHIDVQVRELECDYYGASGHKWLMGPLGTGCLYVRRELIRGLWPLTPSWEEVRTDIRKFEWVGGQSPAAQIAIADALTFHERLGTERKGARLHYLKRRWAQRLGGHPRIRISTDLAAGRSCGLGSFSVDGIDHATLARHLVQRHQIFVFAFGREEYEGPPGIRVAPNVFTSAREIDLFADAVETILRAGLSGAR